MHKKKQPIIALKKDDIVNDIFAVKFKKPIEPYKNGYKFELRLADSSMEIMYKYWGPPEEVKVQMLYDLIKKDDVVLVQGRVSEWNGRLEISANEECALTVLVPGDYDVRDFIKKTSRSVDAMWKELLSLVASVKDSDLRRILAYFFEDLAFAQRFRDAPGAMYIHHGWLGGLLEHTLSVARLCDSMQTLHPTLDRDLLITGALLHDIGKLSEFEMTTSIRMTAEGMLVGHVMIAAEMLAKAMDSLKTPGTLRMKLTHIIMTHMGEYGSSKKPAFPEALAIHYADKTDGDLMHMTTLIKEAQTEDDFIYHKDFGNLYLE